MVLKMYGCLDSEIGGKWHMVILKKDMTTCNREFLVPSYLFVPAS